MKVTTKGLILALKNIGAWLASYTVSGIKSDPPSFLFALLVYVLINTPSDLYLLNHWDSQKKPSQSDKQ